MNRRKKIKYFNCLLSVLVCFLLLPIQASVAQEPATTQQEKDAALIKDAQNPIANMISLPFQSNFNFGYGPDDEMQYILKIQPVIPFSLPHGWTLVTRHILPIVYQPWPKKILGLANLDSSLFFVPPSSGSWMFGLGPIFEFPTATRKTFLGTQKWSAGPTGVVVYSKGKFLGGALIQNLFSFAGNSKRQDVNEMTLQPFINYNLPNAWYICSSPLITANWEADGSQVWTVPVGLGLGRLVHFGKLPVNIALQGYYNVVRPDNQSDWTIRLGVTLLFPEK